MNGDLSVIGTVFNIQNFSIHDGPGIRTLVFLKGCPLRCTWCSNPESQNPHPELVIKTTRCLGFSKCAECLKSCEEKAISFGANGIPLLERAQCPSQCHTPCVERCPSKAMHVFGERLSVEAVLAAVSDDASFYMRSEGGLTVSGGEPTAQPDFLLALLRQANARCLNTAMETSAFCRYETLQASTRLLDTLICDLKLIEKEKHKRLIGMDNVVILENIERIASDLGETDMLIRTPVVPGVNDSEEEVTAIASFVEKLPAKIRYEMLPYHCFGTQKYAFLGRDYPMGDVQLDKDHMKHLVSTAVSILGERLVNE